MIMAAFMVAAVTANAQGEVGTLTIQPKIGMNLANVVNAKNIGDSKLLVGMAGGVEAEYVVVIFKNAVDGATDIDCKV